MRGIYRYRTAPEPEPKPPHILASGVAMPGIKAPPTSWPNDWDVAADVWSVTSWGELNRDGVAPTSHHLRHPDRPARAPYITQALESTTGPVLAVSDWMRAVPEQIRPWIPHHYTTLGTDGFGFSDTRPAARRYYNTDAESLVVATLEALAHAGAIDHSIATTAANHYQIDDVQAAP